KEWYLLTNKVLKAELLMHLYITKQIAKVPSRQVKQIQHLKKEVAQHFANISWLKEFPSIKNKAGCTSTGFIFMPSSVVERYRISNQHHPVIHYGKNFVVPILPYT